MSGGGITLLHSNSATTLGGRFAVGYPGGVASRLQSLVKGFNLEGLTINVVYLADWLMTD
jgi:hypothetical protein